MSPRVRRHVRELLAIAGFVAVASVVSAYILDHQRLRWPWEDAMRIEATFSTAQAVAPGQGQTVTVAGVRVGEIAGVRLEEGRAVVAMDLDSDELGPVYRNATMLLRPKTGLNDMSIQLDPGSPDPSLPGDGRLREGDRLPAAATLPNVHPDQVLAALDADARRYLGVVATAGGQGLAGRGRDLRRLLAAAQPTLEHTRRITAAVTDRRRQLRRLVTNLRRLSSATAARDEELASLVAASARALEAIGGREAELAETVERLPGTVAAARDALAGARALAAEAGPAARELLPLARVLEPALVEARPLLRDATPILRDQLRPLARDGAPVVRSLGAALRRLERGAPELVPTAEVLEYTANELGHNPPGPEEGYLFWTAWFAHNAHSLVSVEDAHGSIWRGLAMVGCSTFGELVASDPALEPFAEAAACPQAPGRQRGGER